MIALWLLILRGIAVEFRNHLAGPIWAPFWDAVFALASALLALIFGAALGNVVRGVPLDPAGTFFVPLWTDFRVGPQPGALDWYTGLVALAAAAALLVHGASWVAMKAPLALAARARNLAWRSWWLVAVLTIGVTIATFNVQPQISISLAATPLGFLGPALALSGIAAGLVQIRRRADVLAFLASTLYLIGMLGSVFVGLYPVILPASGDPTLALTVENAAAGEHGLRVALLWWIPGILLVASYFILTYRHFSGRVSPAAEGH
jgi:cytochrome d ubiquinol oxidase subunit II